MDKFKVGDRVICLVDSPADNESIHKGDTGTICSAEAHDSWIGVCWDKLVDGGHSCSGDCEHGFGWRVPIETLLILSRRIANRHSSSMTRSFTICSDNQETRP